jgi:hypothetical protein
MFSFLPPNPKTNAYILPLICYAPVFAKVTRTSSNAWASCVWATSIPKCANTLETPSHESYSRATGLLPLVSLVKMSKRLVHRAPAFIVIPIISSSHFVADVIIVFV